MVDSSALLKVFVVAYVIGWLMDFQIINGIEVMKDYDFYLLCDCYQLEL